MHRDGALDEELAEGWRFSEANTSLNLISAPPSSGEGGHLHHGGGPGMVSEALGPAAQPPFIPQQLLDTCADLDHQVSLSPVAQLCVACSILYIYLPDRDCLKSLECLDEHIAVQLMPHT